MAAAAVVKRKLERAKIEGLCTRMNGLVSCRHDEERDMGWNNAEGTKELLGRRGLVLPSPIIPVPLSTPNPFPNPRLDNDDANDDKEPGKCIVAVVADGIVFGKGGPIRKRIGKNSDPGKNPDVCRLSGTIGGRGANGNVVARVVATSGAKDNEGGCDVGNKEDWED